MSIKKQRKFHTFGDSLLYAIKKKGLNQAIFSRNWGKDPSMVNKYIKNDRMPRPESVTEMEQLLSVKFQEIDGEWLVISDPDAQKAIDSVNRLREIVAAYKAQSLTRDEIPELLEFRDMIDKDVDALVKKNDDQ